MFFHFINWIPSFYEKSCPLTEISEFPFLCYAFRDLKTEDCRSHCHNNRPFYFACSWEWWPGLRHNSLIMTTWMTCSILSGDTQQWKKVNAIVESIRIWRHYLIARHFKITTDHKSITFMFSPKRGRKRRKQTTRKSQRGGWNFLSSQLIYSRQREWCGLHALKDDSTTSSKIDIHNRTLLSGPIG